MAEQGTVCLFLDAVETIALDPDFKGSTYRVLFLLVGLCEGGNYVDGSIRALATQLHLCYDTVRQAWRLLEAKDWLRPVQNQWGRVHRYRLSPYLCWRGRPWKARIAQRNWDAEADLRRLASQWEGTEPK